LPQIKVLTVEYQPFTGKIPFVYTGYSHLSYNNDANGAWIVVSGMAGKVRLSTHDVDKIIETTVEVPEPEKIGEMI
jgi:hypothetical protein